MNENNTTDPLEVFLSEILFEMLEEEIEREAETSETIKKAKYFFTDKKWQ